MIGLARQEEGLYFLIQPIFKQSTTVHNCIVVDLWYYRLRHVPTSRINFFWELDLTISISDTHVCDICYFAKEKKLPFPVGTSSTSSCFDMIHVDIWGPICSSMDGYRYFLSIVDGHSRYTWLCFMKNKSEVISHFQNFYSFVLT